MTPEELIEAQKRFEDERGSRQALYAGLESMANVPTVYEIQKGRNIGPRFEFTSPKPTDMGPLEAEKQRLALMDEEASKANDLAKKEAQVRNEDPQGKLAKSMRLLYKSRGLEVDETLSPMEMVQVYGKPSEVLQMGLRADTQKQLVEDRAKAQKDLIQARQAGKAQAASQVRQGLSEQDKLGKLNASDKARFDNVLMTAKAINEMEQALKSGQGRYSLVGDNDYTIGLTKATEALGRMQSGGAISKDEEARFEKMLRSLGDTPETQAKKLSQLREEMKSRYQTLGFDPAKSPVFSMPQENAPPTTMGTQGGQASQASGMSPQQKALAELERRRKAKQ